MWRDSRPWSTQKSKTALVRPANFVAFTAASKSEFDSIRMPSMATRAHPCRTPTWSAWPLGVTCMMRWVTMSLAQPNGMGCPSSSTNCNETLWSTSPPMLTSLGSHGSPSCAAADSDWPPLLLPGTLLNSMSLSNPVTTCCWLASSSCLRTFRILPALAWSPFTTTMPSCPSLGPERKKFPSPSTLTSPEAISRSSSSSSPSSPASSSSISTPSPSGSRPASWIDCPPPEGWIASSTMESMPAPDSERGDAWWWTMNHRPPTFRNTFVACMRRSGDSGVGMDTSSTHDIHAVLPLTDSWTFVGLIMLLRNRVSWERSMASQVFMMLRCPSNGSCPGWMQHVWGLSSHRSRMLCMSLSENAV
mmetsp:Transcript_8106/g.23029  ORF Transcript_8106/g.23029 Transcript_8106/m.23029 type:complete len:361 (-) Transcript_8106:229-1311(-)